MTPRPECRTPVRVVVVSADRSGKIVGRCNSASKAYSIPTFSRERWILLPGASARLHDRIVAIARALHYYSKDIWCTSDVCFQGNASHLYHRGPELFQAVYADGSMRHFAPLSCSQHPPLSL